jgi:hypothetical protein
MLLRLRRNNNLTFAVSHASAFAWEEIMAHGEEAGGAEHSLKESAAQLAEQQKKAGARQMSGIAGAVHAAADQLEAQLPGAAGYIHDAAERIDHAASDLRNSSLSDLADGVRRIAHERPLALIGGSVLAGFVLTRFLMSANGGRARQGGQGGM